MVVQQPRPVCNCPTSEVGGVPLLSAVVCSHICGHIQVLTVTVQLHSIYVSSTCLKKDMELPYLQVRCMSIEKWRNQVQLSHSSTTVPLLGHLEQPDELLILRETRILMRFLPKPLTMFCWNISSSVNYYIYIFDLPGANISKIFISPVNYSVLLKFCITSGIVCNQFYLTFVM